jgi:hypothetical protein
VFLLANDDELLRRFAETRRKHPISTDHVSLKEAIAIERRLLEPILNAADLVIDTSRMGVHDLRDLISQRVEKRSAARLSLLVESFGFKNGIPGDADFVFDARALPNPYWDPSLRALTGRDADVIRFLEAQRSVPRLLEDILQFVAARIPEHQAANRRYLTIAIGCTGGRHRSVYLAERVAERLAQSYPVIAIRHNSPRRNALDHARSRARRRAVGLIRRARATKETPSKRRRPGKFGTLRSRKWVLTPIHSAASWKRPAHPRKNAGSPRCAGRCVRVPGGVRPAWSPPCTRPRSRT